MPTPAETTQFPGFRLVDNWMRAQNHVWRRHLDALNEVWGDLTAEGASADTVLSGCSKLMQVWSDNAQHLLDNALMPLSAQSLTKCPVVAFAIDQVAESSDTRSLPLSAAVDPELVRIAPVGGGAQCDKLAQHLSVTVNPSGHALEITLMNLNAFGDKSGVRQALIYVDAVPPPKPALALVVVSFTP